MIGARRISDAVDTRTCRSCSEAKTLRPSGSYSAIPWIEAASEYGRISTRSIVNFRCSAALTAFSACALTMPGATKYPNSPNSTSSTARTTAVRRSQRLRRSLPKRLTRFVASLGFNSPPS